MGLVSTVFDCGLYIHTTFSAFDKFLSISWHPKTNSALLYVCIYSFEGLMEGLVALLIDTLARKAFGEETCIIF